MKKGNKKTSKAAMNVASSETLLTLDAMKEFESLAVA
jgi:hypothetical protein